MVNKVIVKQITEINPVVTAHNIGLKKVLLSKSESSSNITQIAITSLTQDEFVDEHVHKTMEEHYIIQKGSCEISVGDEKYFCDLGTYIYIPAGLKHSLKIITNVEIITIGVSV